MANRYVALRTNWQRGHRGGGKHDRGDPNAREIVLIPAPQLRQLLVDKNLVRAIGDEVSPAQKHLAKIVSDAGARLAHELLEAETDSVFLQVAPDRRTCVMSNNRSRNQLVHIRQLRKFGFDELGPGFSQPYERSVRDAFEFRVEVPVPVVANDAQANAAKRSRLQRPPVIGNHRIEQRQIRYRPRERSHLNKDGAQRYATVCGLAAGGWAKTDDAT